MTAFSSSLICENATREASSIQKWMNSQPTPRLLLWPVRSPVMRWQTLSKRPSFLISIVDHVAGVGMLVAAHWLGRLQIAHSVEPEASQNVVDEGWR